MERLAPPIKLLDAQPWNGGTLVEHQRGFLLKGQTAAEIHGTLVGREGGVLIREFLGAYASGAEAENSQQDVF